MNDRRSIARLIDHSVLRPEATDDDVREACAVAVKYGTASVCVRPSDLPLARTLIAGSQVALCTVIGFPHGDGSSIAKLAEADHAMRSGAIELDMVLNIGRLCSGDATYVATEIGAVTKLAHSAGAKVKIILETCYLTDDQIITACKVCNDAGVDWVKTSTGFGSGGATPAAVKLMRSTALPSIGVKASGGIRDLEQLLLFRDLGCSRIGTSSTQKIVDALSED